MFLEQIVEPALFSARGTVPTGMSISIPDVEDLENLSETARGAGDGGGRRRSFRAMGRVVCLLRIGSLLGPDYKMLRPKQ